MLKAAVCLLLVAGLAIAPQQPSSPVEVYGDIVYVTSVEKAFATMNLAEKHFVALYTQQVTNTRALDGAYVWDGVTNIKGIYHPVHLAGILLHEAVHHESYALCRWVGGVEDEALGIDKMVSFYRRKGYPGWADYYEGLKGIHGQGYPMFQREGCDVRE